LLLALAPNATFFAEQFPILAQNIDRQKQSAHATGS